MSVLNASPRAVVISESAIVSHRDQIPSNDTPDQQESTNPSNHRQVVLPLLRYIRDSHEKLAASPAELSYKILFAVLAVANHICGVIVYGWDVHRYLTYISSLATTLAKVLSLSELFVSYRFKDIAEHHWFRETTNYFQVLTSTVEMLVFVFYWAILAYFDYTQNDFSTEDHILNITMHVMCPIIAITPVFLERTDFGLKQLAGVFTAGIIYLGYMVSYAVRTDKGIYHPLFTFRDVLTYILVLVVLLLILGFFYLFKWVNKKMVEKYNLKRQTTVQPQ